MKTMNDFEVKQLPYPRHERSRRLPFDIYEVVAVGALVLASCGVGTEKGSEIVAWPVVAMLEEGMEDLSVPKEDDRVVPGYGTGASWGISGEMNGSYSIPVPVAEAPTLP